MGKKFMTLHGYIYLNQVKTFIKEFFGGMIQYLKKFSETYR